MRFAKINTQGFSQASQKHGIRDIPTMIGFTKGREKGRQSGVFQAPQIEAFAAQTFR